MKLEWVKIGELGKVKTGTTPPTNRSEFYGDYIPFIKPSDIEVDKRYTPNPNFFHSELGAEYFQSFWFPKVPLVLLRLEALEKKLHKLKLTVSQISKSMLLYQMRCIIVIMCFTY